MEFDSEHEYESYVHGRRLIKAVGALALFAALTAYACDFHRVRSTYPIDYEGLFRALHSISTN